MVITIRELDSTQLQYFWLKHYHISISGGGKNMLLLLVQYRAHYRFYENALYKSTYLLTYLLTVQFYYNIAAEEPDSECTCG